MRRRGGGGKWRGWRRGGGGIDGGGVFRLGGIGGGMERGEMGRKGEGAEEDEGYEGHEHHTSGIDRMRTTKRGVVGWYASRAFGMVNSSEH